MRPYTVEQQHHALRIASSRELNSTEASALIRGVEAYRDAETEIAQLRAEVLALKQERDDLRKSFDRTIDREDVLRRELDSARASERRLRELLAWAAMMLPQPWPLPATIGHRIQDAIKGIAIKAEQALTDDPPGQEVGRG